MTGLLPDRSSVAARLGLRLVTTSAPVGLDLDDLVVPALRNNPRRAQLWVSTVLGKHLPVDPDVVDGFGRLLGALVGRALRPAGEVPPTWTTAARAALSGTDPTALLRCLPLPDRAGTGPVVIGYAETATALGHCVADALDARFVVHTTRRLVPGATVSATFEESHSHASTHYLTPILALSELPEACDTLVLVDDELSTGRTALATIRALHADLPRARYVIATLVDLRPARWRAELDAVAADLGCRIDVVALACGEAELPDDLPARAATLLADAGPPLGGRSGTVVGGGSSTLLRTDDAPDGRFGLLPQDRELLDARAASIAAELAPLVDERGRMLVIGTEEFMYLPLRVALALRRGPGHPAGRRDVRFQSTTRSPVHPLDEPGYPVRRRFVFGSAEPGQDAPRFLYNAGWPHDPGSPTSLSGPCAGTSTPETLQAALSTNAAGPTDGRQAPEPGGEPDVVVVITDPATAGPDATVGGLPAELAAAGLPVVVVVVGDAGPGARHLPARLRAAREPLVRSSHAGRVGAGRTSPPGPLHGPAFGSYRPDEVSWLLTDLSDADLERDVELREARIQAGTAHYAESLPVEYQPGPAYQQLFDDALASSAQRLATAVGVVTERVLAERGSDMVLASLARAGTPIGILLRRWARRFHGLDLPHYAVSIVRDRGIDPVALDLLADRHDPASVVFVDGWTGKGAIARELAEAVREYAVGRGPVFDPELAVLADPGHCVRTYGTRDDFLIASACLNSTVSGLVSRTVLNTELLRPGQFHGAKFYRELAGQDVSARFLDAVTAAFDRAAPTVAATPAPSEAERRPTFEGWRSAEQLRQRYGIDTVNFVKPGVGETTRVLLRRAPWRVLVRDPDDPALRHVRLLAAERGVPVETVPDLAYACVGLIRRVAGGVEPQ